MPSSYWENVLSHTNICEGEEAVSSLKARELGVNKSSCNLSRSVGTEVEEDNAVVRLDCIAALDDNRNNELVRYLVVVAVLNSRNGAVSLDALAVNECRVSLLDALPAVVSVHSVVTSRNGGNLAHADFVHFLDRLGDIFLSGSRGNVTSVEERVNIYLCETLCLRELKDSVKVSDVAVNAARGHKSHQVETRVVLERLVHSVDDSLVLAELAVVDSLCDSGELLINNSARADVGVTDLAVAHLTVGETYVKTRSADLREGVLAEENVKIGSVCGGNGVSLGGSNAEAVQYHK